MYTNTTIYPVRCATIKKYNEISRKNLNKGFKTKGVSEATQRKIMASARVLSYCAISHERPNKAGNFVPFLISFITLTLPSSQQHSDQRITKEVLGSFLNICRKAGFLQNYVWRAEKQLNGNIHYHVITDSEVIFSKVRRYWNKACDKLGYRQRYKDKFRKMTLKQYREQGFNKEKDFQTIVKAYARGRKSNWSNPPSVQVDYLQNIGTVAAYISKYIAKSQEKEPNIVTGRVWGGGR